MLLVMPTAPYYISYLNPFAGGYLTAPQVIKIGWGEGMDQVGAWLETQAQPATLKVGASYASTLSPYFSGRVSGADAEELDYLVDYVKQRHSLPPAIRDYWADQGQPTYRAD